MVYFRLSPHKIVLWLWQLDTSLDCILKSMGDPPPPQMSITPPIHPQNVKYANEAEISGRMAIVMAWSLVIEKNISSLFKNQKSCGVVCVSKYCSSLFTFTTRCCIYWPNLQFLKHFKGAYNWHVRQNLQLLRRFFSHTRKGLEIIIQMGDNKISALACARCLHSCYVIGTD